VFFVNNVSQYQRSHSALLMCALVLYCSLAMEAGYQALSNLLSIALDAICGAWIEGIVVAIALHVYFANSKRGLAAGKKQEQPKHPATQSRQATPVKRSGGRGLDRFISRRSGQSRHEDAQKVQKLVVSLLAQGSHCTLEALEQYEDLVRRRHVDLRRHIPDASNARSMYIALIACVASLPPAAGVSAQSSSSASSSSVSSRRWISRLLADMRAFGFQRTVEFYAGVQRSLVYNRLLEDVLWLYDVMSDDNAIPNINMYICFMNVAIACNDNRKALLFFAEMSKLGPPSLRTYMTVLRVYSKNKDWKKAVELLDHIQACGASPDNLVLNNVLGLCISAGQVTIAEKLVYRWKDLVDVISCNILLKGCAQIADLDKSEEVLEHMNAEGPAPNLITFNTVMDCAVRALQVLSSNCKHAQLRNTNFDSKDADEDGSSQMTPVAGSSAGAGGASSQSFMVMARRPWDLLDRLLKLGLEPDRYTCSTLVKGMHLAGCSISEIDRAVELLHRIGREALQFQSASTGSSQSCNARLLEVLFNTLLDACITVRDLDRMAKIFEMMQDFGVNVSAVTFGTLIKAFGQAGRLSRCREVWMEMQEAKIHPTIVTYGCYIDACIRNEDLTAAEGIFQSMAMSGVRPNAVIYTSLIRGFAHSKQPGKALSMYRRMREEGIEATSVTFNSILDVVARQLSEPAMLEEVLEDMRKASISPDVITYSILIKASCSAGNLQNALSLFKQIRSHGLVFDQVAFNTLLLACSKAVQVADAEEIFEEMRSLGMTPTHVTTSIMIKMYGKAKMLDKAIALSEMMRHDYGKEPNLFVYTCLIQACAQNKHVRRSWEIFNEMLRTGIEPDAITYGTVIHGCVYLNRFDHAMSLVRHAYLKPCPASVKLETPFAIESLSLTKPVPLQQDVLQMLLAALKRKEQLVLITELEAIISESDVAGNVSGAPQKKHARGMGRRYGNGDEDLQ